MHFLLTMFGKVQFQKINFYFGSLFVALFQFPYCKHTFLLIDLVRSNINKNTNTKNTNINKNTNTNTNTNTKTNTNKYKHKYKYEHKNKQKDRHIRLLLIYLAQVFKCCHRPKMQLQSFRRKRKPINKLMPKENKYEKRIKINKEKFCAFETMAAIYTFLFYFFR